MESTQRCLAGLVTYSSATSCTLRRYSSYKFIYDRVKPPKPFNDLTVREKAVLSGSVGAFAAFITSPFELVQTRMIADGGAPIQYRRNYKSCFDGIARIQAEEGTRER